MAHFKLKSITLGLATSLCIISTGSAYASAFNLWEYNGADIGNYNAGAAAIAEDASTSFTNPAGMVRLKHTQIVVSGDPVQTHSAFHGQACGGLTTPGSGTPVGTPASACVLSDVPSDDGGAFAVVPAMHVVIPINDRWFVGLSTTAPFGLTTDFGRNTNVRYSGTRSKIVSININPNVAFKINDHWSVGVGFDAMYFNAELNANVNLFPGGGTVVVPNVGPVPVAPQGDAEAENHADDWGYGWNAGVLWQYDENTRVGLSYRSQVVVQPTGTSKLTGSYVVNQRVTNQSTNIQLPPSTILSAFHKFNKHWAVMGTVAYTQWNTIEEMVLKRTVIPGGTPALIPAGGPTLLGLPFLTNTTIGPTTLPQNYKNTWRASIGVDYTLNEKWRFRTGVGFDQTPVQTEDRTVRLMDGNRIAVAIGAGYRYNENLGFDVGYEHLFIQDGSVNQTNSLARTIGYGDNSADVFGLQANFTFT